MKKQEVEKGEQLINPFTSKPCSESITEKEAKERGYEDLQFILRHLENDNEFFQWFIIDNKDIIVKRSRPYLNYKKPTQINHERLFDEGVKAEAKTKQTPIIPDLVATDACNLDSEDGCIACGS